MAKSIELVGMQVFPPYLPYMWTQFSSSYTDCTLFPSNSHSYTASHLLWDRRNRILDKLHNSRPADNNMSRIDHEVGLAKYGVCETCTFLVLSASRHVLLLSR